MQRFFLYSMAALYVAAGINHFVNPAMYRKILPPWLPWPAQVVALSGLAEILFGLLLCFPATRVFAAWAIIALLVAVFPANVQMILNYQHQGHPGLWLAVLRLPLQLVLIWWAYQYTRP